MLIGYAIFIAWLLLEYIRI